jgi:hypothetical protein
MFEIEQEKLDRIESYLKNVIEHLRVDKHIAFRTQKDDYCRLEGRASLAQELLDEFYTDIN